MTKTNGGDMSAGDDNTQEIDKLPGNWFDNLPVPCLVVEHTGKIVRFNISASELGFRFGYFQEWLVPSLHKRLHDLLGSPLQSPDPSPFIANIVDSTGRDRTWNLHIRQVGTGNQSIVTLTPRQPEPGSVFDQILDNTALGIAWLNSRGNFLSVNRQWSRMFGFSVNQMTEMSFWDFVYPEDFMKIKPPWDKVRNGGLVSVSLEGRGVRREGLPLWVGITLTGVRDTDGTLDRILMTAFDINELKTSQWRLRYDNEFFGILQDSLPIGVFHRDRNGYFQGCNSTFEKFFGLSRDLINWQTAADLLPQEISDPIAEIDLSLIENPGVRTFEAIHNLGDDRHREYLISIVTYYDIDPVIEGFIGQDEEDRPIEGFIGVVVDITDQKNTERDLKESSDHIRRAHDTILDLERKNMALALAATANHEINQPLMVLKGNLDLLKMMLPESVQTEKIKGYFDKIDQSQERIQLILKRYKEADGIQFEDYSRSTKIVVFKEENKE